MKALVLQAIKEPCVIEERAPLKPGAGEVVVALRAAALNRRDYWITRGMYPGIQTPVILGSDGAGIVSSAGDGVDASRVGQEVIVDPSLGWGENEAYQSDSYRILGMPDDGTFATEVRIPDANVQPRPSHLNWEEAAALPLAGLTAFRAVFSRAGLRSGERTLITGIGGGVATLALQFALAAGAMACVTSSSDEKLARAAKLGAHGTANYKSDGWAKDLRAQHGGFDVIIDGAGGEGFADLIALAAPGGRVVSYGSTAGTPPTLDLFKVFWKQLNLLGSTMGSPRDFQAMLRFVSEHEIHPVVDDVIDLEDGNAAIDKLRTGSQFGNVVLRTR